MKPCACQRSALWGFDSPWRTSVLRLPVNGEAFCTFQRLFLFFFFTRATLSRVTKGCTICFDSIIFVPPSPPLSATPKPAALRGFDNPTGCQCPTPQRRFALFTFFFCFVLGSRALANHPFWPKWGVIWGPRAFPRKSGRARASRLPADEARRFLPSFGVSLFLCSKKFSALLTRDIGNCMSVLFFLRSKKK